MSGLWRRSKRLLRTHADVIYCDSIWATEKHGSKLATIVVVNRDNNIHLAAAAIMQNETANSWGLFFRWVKECVPTLCPKCVVTDGASIIFSEFENVFKPKQVTHITCWWHKRNTFIRKYGGGRFTKSLTGISYCDDFAILQHRRCELQKMIKQNEAHISEKSVKKTLLELEDSFENAFIRLKVFTGGTITNNYAESINRRLRDIGLCTQSTRFDAILRLRGFCKFPQAKNVRLSPESLLKLNDLMQEDVIRVVSNNVLMKQLQLVEEASKKCRITGVRDNRFIVSEDVTISIGDKYETSGEAQATVEWIDTTDLEYVSCSCNRLVYQGMPCMHILHVAQEQKKRIPLLCFNDRFFCQAPMTSLPTFSDSGDDGR